MPDYAYPNLKLNRQELRIEMNKPSAYYHDLRQPSQYPNEVGILSLEILQCFGIPRNDVLKETSAFAIAGKTDLWWLLFSLSTSICISILLRNIYFKSVDRKPFAPTSCPRPEIQCG